MAATAYAIPTFTGGLAGRARSCVHNKGGNGRCSKTAVHGKCSSWAVGQREGAMTRVLLVDDDVNLREALESAMTAAGHDVTVANNGLEALTTAVTASPQVIVTDV